MKKKTVKTLVVILFAATITIGSYAAGYFVKVSDTCRRCSMPKEGLVTCGRCGGYMEDKITTGPAPYYRTQILYTCKNSNCGHTCIWELRSN